MPNKLEVTFEGDHVLVISEGDQAFEYAVKVWTRVVDMCTQHDCYNVLGLAHSTSVLEAVEGYDQARLFVSLGIDEKYRIAWVEQDEDAQDMAEFIETILSNRGLPGKLFANEAEARSWLLAEPPQLQVVGE